MTDRMPEGSLVVVGNRLPPAVRKGGDGARVERAPGGLVATLEPALQRRGGPGSVPPAGRYRDADAALVTPP